MSQLDRRNFLKLSTATLIGVTMGGTSLRAGVVDAQSAAPPTRRVVLAWRRSFTRYEAIAELRNAIYACELAGVKRLS